jgi:hypothetical protein
MLYAVSISRLATDGIGNHAGGDFHDGGKKLRASGRDLRGPDSSGRRGALFSGVMRLFEGRTLFREIAATRAEVLHGSAIVEGDESVLTRWFDDRHHTRVVFARCRGARVAGGSDEECVATCGVHGRTIWNAHAGR